MRQHVEAAAGRIVCVVGGPGEGKSTLAAMMLSTGEETQQTLIHAAHFCKRATQTGKISVALRDRLGTSSLDMLTTPTEYCVG